MKALRIFAIVIGCLVVLVVVAVLLALTPAVQTWAVRRAVANQPGLKLDVGRVAAGLSSADITDLHVVKDGMVITAKNVTAHYTATDFLFHHRINVDDATVTDLVADLRAAAAPTNAATTAANPPGAPASSPNASGSAPRTASTSPGSNASPANSFHGLLSQAQLPFDIRIAKFAANGRALLPAGQTATFQLHGANIENGQRGTVEWTADFADATKDAALTAAHSTGSATLHLTTDRRIDRAEIDANATAQGPKLPSDRLELQARAEAPDGGDENYSATLNLVHNGSATPLLESTAHYAAAAGELAGTWKLAVRSEQLAALLAGFGLPEIAAQGAGKFTFNPATSAASANGELQADTTHLEKIAPELAAIGAMRAHVAFDGALADNVAQLARLQIEATAADGRKLAEIDILQRVRFSLADQRVSLADPQADLARVSVQALPLAWAQPFVKDLAIDSGTLSLALAVEAEPDGSRIHAKTVEPVTLRDVTVRQGDRKLVDQLTFSASPRIDYSSKHIVADLADLRAALPAGDTLAGTAHADVATAGGKSPIAFSSQLQGKIVAALKPYLPVDPGPLTLATSVQGRLEGDSLQVAKASATVNRENGGVLAKLDLQQPLTADLNASTFSVANPAATAARVQLGEVPLAWAQAFVPNSTFAGSVAGATLEVSFRSADDLTVTTASPVTLRGVTATLDGKPMLRALDVSADLTASKRGDVVAYDLRRLELKQGNATLTTLAVAGQASLGDTLAVTAKGNLDADLPALMNQPVAASFATLSRGQLTSTFDANFAGTLQAKATLSAKNLVARQNNQALGDLDVTLTATAKPDGSGTVVMPVTLTNTARRSDLTVEGAYGRGTDQKSFLFAGKISSNQIFVDDFQPLAAVAPASETPAPAPTNAPAPRTPPVVRTPSPTRGATPTTAPAGRRDTKPFWAGVQGKVAVDLKRIVYGKDYVISGVHGTSVVTADKLSLDGLEGNFKNNPFKLAGGVTFAANQPRPYSLTASANVQGLDIGEILRAANPNEKPVFETKATLVAQLQGSGGTIVETAKDAYGKFELTGTDGVTRLLARRGGASTAVNIASSALAIAGIFQKNEGTAQALGAAAELTRLLNEVHFDRVKVNVERAPDLSFKLTSIEILSPILHTSGTGTVDSKSAGDVANAPMNITLQLGAKGELAYALQKAGLLGSQQDALGYTEMARTFTIGGTPSKPDNSSLWSILLQTGLNIFGR